VDIRNSMDALDVDLDEHIRFIIAALQPHVAELGIGPR
jgi:hypothetical protein